MNNNIDYDNFVRNPPNPIDYNDIFNDSLSDTLFSFFSTSPIPNSFNISSFNVNGLKTSGQGSFKIDQISSFFTQQYISFGGVVDTHLSPKQMKFLSKRIKDYSSFHSDLDSTKHGRSSGGNVKLRIFVVYIPSTNDPILRNTVIDQLISLICLAASQNFHHVTNNRIHRLFYYLLSHNYEDCTPLNLSPTLGTYHHLNTITRIDFVWSCSLLCHYMLTASIFDAHDLHISDHNSIITYFDTSLLTDAIKSAHAQQLNHNVRRVFKFNSPLNQKCEYLHSRILRAAKTKLPSVTVGNTYTPKKPKDLKSLTQSYQFLSKVAKSIRLLHKTPTLYSLQFESKCRTFLVPIILPPSLYEEPSSIQANIDVRNNNFTNDISTFIESALSRTRCRIILDRVFVDHPTNPVLHTSLDTIDREVIDHFQNFVPITSSPSSSIDDLPKKWSDVYEPLVKSFSNIYDFLMDPSSLDELSSTIASMPNDKASGPLMILYEMLKHLSPHASSLLLLLVSSCLSESNIPDL
ncbi:hypothetical protein RhiirC2_794056 [Rhizophagus irregularis]|uniref:Uncharacterized protein n=1 Tax=Rhizophagus irregularis TaxID=588596 RepID=A0A2N1ME80_9GLOM|nr:hypothetical protein RhiirC2_794056 [Rhizophagus irregularis]